MADLAQPVPNTSASFIGLGYDWSGIGLSNTEFDAGRAYFTPQHYIYAKHAGGFNALWTVGVNNPNALLIYDGIPHETTAYGNNSDLAVGTSKTPVPYSRGVARYAILDYNSVSTSDFFGNYSGLQVFLTGREHVRNNNTCIVSTTVTTAYVSGNLTYFTTPDSAALLEGGDSGQPAFHGWTNPNGDKELTLLGNNYGFTTGTLYLHFLGNRGVIDQLNLLANDEGYAVRCSGKYVYTTTGPTTVHYDNITWIGGLAGNPTALNQTANWSLGLFSDKYVLFDAGNSAPRATLVAGNMNLRGIYFKSTAATGDGFTLGGSSTLTIGRGGITNYDSDKQTITAPLLLGKPQYWSIDRGEVAVATINNSGFLMEKGGNGTLSVSGAISGAAGLALSGGLLTLNRTNSYTGPTWAHDGVLRVNGSIAASSGVITSAEAIVSGSGVLGTVSGSGTLAPGYTVPGVLTAPSVNPSEGLGFKLRFNHTGSPDYANKSASGNDVLRLTDALPVAGAVTAASEIKVYLNVAAIQSGDAFRGGIFTDRSQPFSVNGAKFNYYVATPGGPVKYYGTEYAAYNGSLALRSDVVPETAGFASGAVSGSVLQIRALAAPATYGTTSGAVTENWSTGTGWSAALVGGSSTWLQFIGQNDTAFADGAAIVSNNDLAGVFQQNLLSLQGTGPATGSAAMTIQGGDIEFVNEGGHSPTVDLNAIKGNGLAYTVKNNVLLTNDTLFTGDGTATFNFAGILSGSGALSKTGGSTLTMGNSTSANGLNDDFLFSGAINVSGGIFKVIDNGNFYTKSKLTIAAGGVLDVGGHMSVFSLFGNSGTLDSTAGSNRNLYVNYTGTDPAAGFTGLISSNGGYAIAYTGATIVGAGSGNLTFSTVAGPSNTLANAGTGTMTAVAIANTGTSAAGAVIATPLGTIKLTGNSGQANGLGTGSIQGTLIIAPFGSGADVVLTGQSLAVTGTTAAAQFRYSSGAMLRLDKGANTRVTYRVGNALSTSTSATQIISASAGTLLLDPVFGAGSLGDTAKFTILRGQASQGNVLPTLTNGLASAGILVLDNDGTRKADFVTYNGTGLDSDVGFQRATYTHTNDFMGATNVSVVKVTADQSVGGATSAFALRNDAVITIGSGQILTLGNPVLGTNAAATQAPRTGLILNGGAIGGSGTLAFGQSEAMVYTSEAGGTISAILAGTGNYNGGLGNYSGNVLVGLNKFGPGTLFLTNPANTYSGATLIQGGALDVGTITNSRLANSTGTLIFGGGVLQGNGTFTRGLGSTGSSVTWNGLNSTYSNMSGGFSARGGNLTVAIGGTASPTALTWGMTSSTSNNFITEASGGGFTGVLIFGSKTADGQVEFRNAVNLGTLSTPNYFRTIYVEQGAGTDSAKMSGVISSTVPHGLIKDGAGKLILSGNNTYSGDTVVAWGSLLIDGEQSAATGLVTVNSGATLGGAGIIGGATLISAGATLAPGNGPGALRAGAATWEGGAIYSWEINSLSGLKGGATGWDWINVAGALNIATGGGPIVINLNSLGALPGWNNKMPHTWTIATASGGIAGFSPDKFTVNTATFSDENPLAGGTFSLAVSGNDLNLVFTPSLTPVQLWRSANGLPIDGSGIGADTYDVSGNGIPNLLKYALGLPADSISLTALPAVSADNDRLSISFQRDPMLVDISYIVEATSDLNVTWTQIASSVAGGAMTNLGGAFSVSETGASLRMVTVQDLPAIGVTPKRFLRLRITRP